MYLEFFGLKEKPFSLTPDPKFFFQSETHKANLEQALYGIMHREGFIVVTGAIGAGKTTLCRTIYDKLDRKTHTAMILNPFLSEDELLETILHEFGILEKGGQRLSKKEMLDKLNEFLLNTLKGGENAILIIDEAQNLPMPALEQIRILSNLETDKEKLLQIILVGQLGLLRLLNSPELQQLDQRISVKCQINPLKKEEVQRYIEYRITVAGSSGEVAFAPDALDLIYEYSLGIPRVINLICDRSLLGAYTQQTTKINKALVLKAVENLKLEKPVMSKQKMAELTSGAPPAAPASATPGGHSRFSSSKVRLPFIIGGSIVILVAFGFLIFVLIQGKGIRA
ncbi:MAG TPA: ExeA family protein, partial [Candidatus Tripitaka californicus]